MGITSAWPRGSDGETLLGVTAVLLITRNCQDFPGFMLVFSFVFQLYDKNGATMSGVLKRKYEELGDDSTYCSSSSCSPLSSSASSGWDTDEENSRGEPKPSSALMSSFTREYLWLSQISCASAGFFFRVVVGHHHTQTPLRYTFMARSGCGTCYLS